MPAFCKLSVEALKKVVANLVLHSYEPGESVIKQGEQGTAFYLIKSGSVEFAVQGKGPVGKRGVGEYFGEVALLSDDNRATASATCSKDGAECYTLQKRPFDLLLKRIMRDERQAKTGRFRYGEIGGDEGPNESDETRCEELLGGIIGGGEGEDANPWGADAQDFTDIANEILEDAALFMDAAMSGTWDAPMSGKAVSGDDARESEVSLPDAQLDGETGHEDADDNDQGDGDHGEFPIEVRAASRAATNSASVVESA